MSRKRLIASLLDDFDEESPSIQSSSIAHSRRNRSIASIVNEETASSSRPSSNIRKKVICNCPDCNGKLVDSRTKELHESTYQEYQGSQSPIWPDIQQLEISEGSASPRRPLEPIEHDEPIEQDSDDDHQSGESAGQPSNLLNEMNKIRMMMIITLMMLSYFGDVQEGTQLVQKFLVVVVMAMMVMTMMVMVMIQMKINLPNILNLSNLPLRKIYTVIIL